MDENNKGKEDPEASAVILSFGDLSEERLIELQDLLNKHGFKFSVDFDTESDPWTPTREQKNTFAVRKIIPDGSSNWVTLRIHYNGFYYLAIALVFDTGSEYGINGGRVSKLNIYEDRLVTGFDGKPERGRIPLVHYDRCYWDIKPNDMLKPLVTLIASYFAEGHDHLVSAGDHWRVEPHSIT